MDYGYGGGAGAANAGLSPMMSVTSPDFASRRFLGPGTGVSDPQRHWDLHQLAGKLQDMQQQVMNTTQAFMMKEQMDGFAEQGQAPPGYADSMNEQMGGFGAQNQLPPTYIDPAQIKISEGWINRKSGRKGFLSTRTWKKRYLRLKNTDLEFFARVDDERPRETFVLDPTVRISVGADKAHKNAKVQNEFVLTSDTTGEEVNLYCASRDETEGWIFTIQYIIATVDAAQRMPLAEGGNAYAGYGGDAAMAAGGQFGGGFMDASQPPPPPDPALLQRQDDEAQAHTAYGQGLYEAVRGEPAFFYIQAHDAQGAPRTNGGDVFQATMVSSELHFDLVPVDNADGTYYVEYTPTRSGDYELRITQNGFDIYGSPFHPVVSAAPTAASHCLVAGDGAKRAEVGKINTFTIVARDQFDEERGVGGDFFEVTIVGPAHISGPHRAVVDHDDGKYTVSYEIDTESRQWKEATARNPTVLEIHVVLNNEGFPYPRPVNGSPLRPAIYEDGWDVSQVLAEQAMKSPQPAQSAPSLLEDQSPDYAARSRELALKEKTLAQSLDQLQEMRRKLEEDRQQVDKQMRQMTELGRKVQEDSERLAQQAQLMRKLAAASPHVAGSSPVGGPAQAAYGDDNNSVITHHTAQRQPSQFMQYPPIVPPAAQMMRSPAMSSPAGQMDASASVASPEAVVTKSALSQEAPAELFDPQVIALFDAHKGSLYSLWQHYASLSVAGGREEEADTARPSKGGMDCKHFVAFFYEYDICPTFIARKELKAIFAAVTKAHAEAAGGQASPSNAVLSYSAFVEALGRMALFSLSKPTFQQLYPTAYRKVEVLLQMWGVADPMKLQGIVRYKASAGAGAKTNGASPRK